MQQVNKSQPLTLTHHLEENWSIALPGGGARMQLTCPPRREGAWPAPPVRLGLLESDPRMSPGGRCSPSVRGGRRWPRRPVIDFCCLSAL